jgi:hypothetical protein
VKNDDPADTDDAPHISTSVTTKDPAPWKGLPSCKLPQKQDSSKMEKTIKLNCDEEEQIH